MGGSISGTIFKISTWGESHGEAIGVVIDGCPSGLPLSCADIQPYLNRRKPGTSKINTPRKEADLIHIQSGVFNGLTTGTPISLMIQNTAQHSLDYEEIASIYRPGHADLTYEGKYGLRDYRGGGRSSGRETAGRVAAGAIAQKILKELGIDVCAYTRAIGSVVVDEDDFDRNAIATTITGMPSINASKAAEKYIEECMRENDSVGGIVECIVNGAPIGLGEPVFEKLDANLSKAIMSIGAVKAVEIGDGISVSLSKGSFNNDVLFSDGTTITKKTNHAGGILGGISDGSTILIKAHIKPTPSIYKTQNTVTKEKQNVEVNIKGRHDPVIVPRAVVVVEAMVAITLVDALFMNMTAKMDSIKKIYECKEE